MPPGWFEQATIWFVLLLTIANSSLQPSVLGEECELISRTVVGNQAYEDGLLRVWFALRKIWFMSSDHWRLSVMVMPKSMVSLAVVSRVPSMWYSLFDSDFCWRCLGTLVCQGSLLRCDSSWRAELSCWTEILSEVFKMILYNLEWSTKIAVLESMRKTSCHTAILLACSD